MKPVTTVALIFLSVLAYCAIQLATGESITLGGLFISVFYSFTFFVLGPLLQRRGLVKSRSPVTFSPAGWVFFVAELIAVFGSLAARLPLAVVFVAFLVVSAAGILVQAFGVQLVIPTSSSRAA